MSISVKLEAFEGPLDLLLHLIDKNKVNIYDIPIIEITKQYLDYIQEMETKDLDSISDFLVMASTLINIKSKMLLPKDEELESEEFEGIINILYWAWLVSTWKFKYLGRSNC